MWEVITQLRAEGYKMGIFEQRPEYSMVNH